jgi:ubiquinone/menaquinone biosynthesis C-methylase UbiE
MPDDLGDALAHRIVPPLTAADFDRQFAATGGSSLVDTIAEQALGDQAVPGMPIFSFVTRWDLQQAIEALRLGPGQVLLDLACGRGGPGLWLAREMGCDLIGVDFSTAALRAAEDHAVRYLPAGRATFRQGNLDATGLPDRSVDGLWCGDAFFFAADLLTALSEVHRVLRPGGRLVMTVAVALDEQPSAHPRDWRPLLRHAGFIPLRQQETPHWRAHITGVYAAWQARETQLRAELPGPVVDDLITEAETVGPRLDQHPRMLVVAESPA